LIRGRCNDSGHGWSTQRLARSSAIMEDSADDSPGDGLAVAKVKRGEKKGNKQPPKSTGKLARKRTGLVIEEKSTPDAFESYGTDESEQESRCSKWLSKIPRPTPVQIVLGMIGSVVLSWVLVMTVFLAILSDRYLLTIVDTTRDRYVLSSSQRVGAKVAQVLEGAHGARQAIDYAVQRQLYFEPLDYDALRMALEPAFAAFVSLRAVDIGFDTKNDSLTIRRQIGSGAQKELLVQSDALDCFEKLGRYGCLSAPSAREEQWFKLGLDLPGGMEADNHSDILEEKLTNFRWADGPGFVPHYAADIVANGTAVAWATAQSLIFRSVFPGTSGQLSLIARAVVEVTDFRAKNSLVDTERIGEAGAIFVTDALGTLLACQMPGEQALILPVSGATRFRKIWELGDVGWAESLNEATFANAPNEQSFKVDSVQVAIRKFTGRGNGHFFTVVVGDRIPFVDAAMQLICETSSIVVWAPYPSVAVVLAMAFSVQEFQRRRRLRRVAAAAAADGRPQSPELKLEDKPTDKSLEVLRQRTSDIKDISRSPPAIGDKA